MSVEIGFSSGHTLRTDKYEEPTELAKKSLTRAISTLPPASSPYGRERSKRVVDPDQIAYLTRA
jgi:hypothetical protein